MSSLPVSAIVGQEELKRVLFALVVDDDLDGALIVGEKGTGKSTAVRGLVDLLPDQRAVADCPYGCAPDEPALQCSECRERASDDLPVETRPVPLVTLPLGATRDRVVGTLSVADALAGEADFDPGLLARAHRGFLYVDEVNLLDDHLVDVLLDAAAGGVNSVERDGVSVSHPADFTLIGTMNPEEGDLRPQLRDRFALQATVEGCRDVADRVEIIDRALDGDAETDAASADAEAELRATLRSARERRERVSLPDEFKAEIAQLCLDAGVDGHRGDIAMARTSMSLAALDGRTTVIESDVGEAAAYALPHRLRSTPFADEPDLEDLLDDRFAERSAGDGDPDREAHTDDASETNRDDDGRSRAGVEAEGPDGDDSDSDGEQVEGDSGPESSDGVEPLPDGRSTDADGRTDTPSDGTAGDRGPASGETAGTTESGSTAGEDTGERDAENPAGDEGKTDDETAHPVVPGQRRASIAEASDARAPALDSPALQEGAPTDDGGSRERSTPSPADRGARVRTEPASGAGPIDAASSVRAAAARGESRVTDEDLRRPVRSGRASATVVFAVDASASMRGAMAEAKGVVLELIRESYERRDEVAVVAFAGADADVILPPTDSVSLAARHLKELPTGDRTPLPAGLDAAADVVDRADSAAAIVVLVTDGRASGTDGNPTEQTRRAAGRLAGTDADVVIVDAGDDSRGSLAPLLADETDGERIPLSSLTAERVRSAARAATDGR